MARPVPGSLSTVSSRPVSRSRSSSLSPFGDCEAAPNDVTLDGARAFCVATFRSSSGSLAMLTAMRRASSLVSVRAPLVAVPFVCSDGCPLKGLDHVRWITQWRARPHCVRRTRTLAYITKTLRVVGPREIFAELQTPGPKLKRYPAPGRLPISHCIMNAWQTLAQCKSLLIWCASID